MPHSDNPTQIALDYSIVNNPTGNGVIKEEEEFVDPRGHYGQTAAFGYEAGDGSVGLFKIDNEGVDLRITRVSYAFSQGAADDGRGWGYCGWDVFGSKYPSERIHHQQGLSQVAQGPHRHTVNVEFQEPMYPPLWEFKDDIYLGLQLNTSSAGPTVKAHTAITFVADDTEDSRL